MHITKIHIENIRCFEKIDINLTNNKDVNNWTLLLGNNGVGKTTILRCIALCLCEESGASGLLDDLEGDFIRKEAGKKPGKIRIEFEKVDNYKKTPFIETTIKRSTFGEIELSQEVYPKRSELWDSVFVCGYGANRRSFGTTSYSEYTTTDATYSLFNYETPMQNIELNLRRIQNEIDLDLLFRKIEDILLLPTNSIKMERNGIHIIGDWGTFQPVGALGDGYQATLAWIMDMYGWKLLFEKELKHLEIKGIVFLDEIEQHLHPFWQKEIIKRLSRQFKGIQFIISTHSPLVTLNSSGELEDSYSFNSKSFVFEWRKHKVEVSEIEEPIIELDYDQLLASEAFGHIYAQNNSRDNLLREMSKLASIDKPSISEKRKLDRIKNLMKDIMFPVGTTLVEREVERLYAKELENKYDELNAILNKK